MKDRKRLIVAALASACVCLLLVLKWTRRVDTTPVLVAKTLIPMGRLVQLQDVEEKSIPPLFMEPGALTTLPEGPLRARIPLLPGEQMTLSKLLDGKKLKGLAWKLAPGQVAVSLALSLEQSVGRAVSPGDWVAILGQDNGMKVLLKNVPVLAIQRPPEAEGPNETALFTLSVSLAQAATLAKAREKSPLQLALLPAFNASQE